MHNVLTKLFGRRFHHVEFLYVSDNFVEVMIGPRRYSINEECVVFEMTPINESEVDPNDDFELETTTWSKWVEGVLTGKIRNEEGEHIER